MQRQSGWLVGWLNNRNIFAIIRYIKSSRRHKHDNDRREQNKWRKRGKKKL